MNTEGKTKGELLAMAEREEARSRTYVSPVMGARHQTNQRTPAPPPRR